jgi:hypothetical protein
MRIRIAACSSRWDRKSITFGDRKMAIAYFPSLSDADIIEVAFATTHGSDLNLHLLVDSGFTGSSSFVLSPNVGYLALGPAFPGHVFGAIHGAQLRVIVNCSIPVLSYQATVVSILADLTPLGLPAGVDGMVGLQFLRRFRRWGAEKMDDGAWRFFLEN